MNAPALPDVSGDWLAGMRGGRWEDAWRATDRIELERCRLQAQPGFAWRAEYLRWNGTPLRGREVMVRCDHGLGDTLQFLRFVPLLGARHVHCMVQPQLLELLRGVPGLGEVHDWWTDDPLPPHEVEIEVMELPYALRTTLASLPSPLPRLREHVQTLASFELERDGRLHVGLLWAASEWDNRRSLPLAVLAPLLGVEDARFFSLQQGQAADDPALRTLPIENLAPRTTHIAQAAAAMCELDLVISIDGMPAHLAGSLGVPTWVLLQREADWRWMEGRDDSPWYPGMRLFRQERAGDWGAVVARVASELARYAARSHGSRVKPGMTDRLSLRA